jgi:hypothetical protein
MPKAKDLAGLAALGFLGYKLFGSKGKDAMGPSATAKEKDDSDARMKAQKDAVSGNTKKDATSDLKTPTESIKGAMKKAPGDEKGSVQSDVLKTVTAPKTASNAQAGNQGVVSPKSSGKSAAAKQAPSDRREDKADTSRKTTVQSSSAEAMKNYVPRRALSPVDQIPGQNRSGPTGGERVSGTELSRNLSNTAAALTPLTGGASKVASEFALGNRAAKAATAEKLSPAGQRLKNMEEIRNVAMPGRRDAVMNPLAHAGGPKMMEKIAAQEGRAIEAEARAAAAQAAREAKTLNPNAWLAGPKGMAENFRRGGAVKMTASRRGDGIASRGKTRGKIC